MKKLMVVLLMIVLMLLLSLVTFAGHPSIPCIAFDSEETFFSFLKGENDTLEGKLPSVHYVKDLQRKQLDNFADMLWENGFGFLDMDLMATELELDLQTDSLSFVYADNAYKLVKVEYFLLSDLDRHLLNEGGLSSYLEHRGGRIKEFSEFVIEGASRMVVFNPAKYVSYTNLAAYMECGDYVFRFEFNIDPETEGKVLADSFFQNLNFRFVGASEGSLKNVFQGKTNSFSGKINPWRPALWGFMTGIGITTICVFVAILLRRRKKPVPTVTEE